jgi:hypothetical protein
MDSISAVTVPWVPASAHDPAVDSAVLIRSSIGQGQSGVALSVLST